MLLLLLFFFLRLHLCADVRHFLAGQVLYGLSWRALLDGVLRGVQLLQGVVVSHLLRRGVHEHLLLGLPVQGMDCEATILEVGVRFELN